MSNPLLELEVPADPAYVGVAAAVARAAAACAELPIDVVEDVDEAVTEAVTHLMSIIGASVVKMEISKTATGLACVVGCDEGFPDSDGRLGALARLILDAVTTDVTVDWHASRASIRFSLG